ncbi:MAG: 50S ribosomal protein L18 [Bacteroidales bacterium]|nr:50S ribosomal protein L18 [Bacteroidales bacterium]MCF8454864.1 50S ribosomal protein L18 [Bacteroidales bacterium]
MALTKVERRTRIKRRIRKKVTGTPSHPRMSIFRSNKQISAQIIDDITQTTLVSASSLHKDIAARTDINKIQQAELVGQLIAQKAKDANIETVVFDRNGYLYHGRVKSLGEAARKAGLKL